MFDSKLPVSYYKEIGVLNKEHDLYIFQHIETGKIYIKKLMTVYNLAVYEQLFKHPIKNVPRIYAMYENNGLLTVIEEYTSGDTLQEILDIHGPLSEAEAISYTMQLCDILSEMHSLKTPIIHRDIKPSNIILTEDGRVILIDLNAARLYTGPKGGDTRLIGTVGYAAPEQFGFRSSSPQTDIYATGVLLTELIGCPLENDKSSSNHRISHKLGKIIDRCLRMEPSKRYNSAYALKTALNNCFKLSL
ncbi:MAG: serine/threonine protein kinase [Lachnospiraceae bacterium]|nr:serine/threonine protein kinase [Lachnospiraceae bacterium]